MSSGFRDCRFRAPRIRSYRLLTILVKKILQYLFFSCITMQNYSINEKKEVAKDRFFALAH